LKGDFRGLSQEQVIKTLVGLGLTHIDARVYIFLAKKGPIKAGDAAKALRIKRQQFYRSLKNLQSKAIVSATLERPARFSAVSFEKVIDLFIRAKLEEAKKIEHDKTALLSSWQAIQVGEAPDTSARFMVIEGRNIIYSRIKQMIDETKSQLSIISTVTGLARADQFGILDASFKHPLRSKLKFKFLTHLTEHNVDTIKSFLKETPKTELRFELRNPNLGLSLFPRMVIRDDEEVMFFITPKVDESMSEQDKVCLWTNCKSLVHSFLAMFEDLWRNSTDIERKIAEIETGKPTPKTFVITNAEAVKKKYDEVFQSAKEEILLLTSSKGLIESLKNMSQLKNWNKKGISVKFMAPVVKENLEAVEQLSKFCAVRHVPIHYWGTTIVDGKHLFQFKTPSSEQEERDSTLRFNNAFYTDDLEWVENMKIALNDIWTSARAPSVATLESIIGPYGPPIVPLPKDILLSKIDFAVIDLKPPGAITEKDVLNKIIHAQKIQTKDPFKDLSKGYGSHALGIIHPPSQFNLPDMMIHAWKHDKQSSFGEEDTIIVHLWLETPTGHAYVPVAIAGDNPIGQTAWRAVYANTPAGKNIQLFKKDQIQVRVYGNTLFAGWTEPIPLYPAKYVLPPACILFEGYGDVKTEALTIIYPSGYKIESEQNFFDAFVTFIHPASKYSGPGTDGIIARDHISTNIPP
jgi:sugar-specific transcriptional regulator TrmB